MVCSAVWSVVWSVESCGRFVMVSMTPECVRQVPAHIGKSRQPVPHICGPDLGVNPYGRSPRCRATMIRWSHLSPISRSRNTAAGEAVYAAGTGSITVGSGTPAS